MKMKILYSTVIMIFFLLASSGQSFAQYYAPQAPYTKANFQYRPDSDGYTTDVYMTWDYVPNNGFSLAVQDYPGGDPGPNVDTRDTNFWFYHISPGTHYVNMKVGIGNVWSNEEYWTINVPNPQSLTTPTPTDSINFGTTTNSNTTNSTSGDGTASFLFWGTLVCSIISIFLFIKSRKKSKYPNEQVKIAFFKQLFYTSLFPTGGFLFSLISYSSSSPGGHYTLLSGVMLIGGFNLVRQVYAYFKAKPELDMLIEAEKILIDNYADILRLYNKIPTEEFENTIVGKYIISRKAAQFIRGKLFEYVHSAKQQENKQAYDPYAVLGVSRSDSLEKIKSKYRELAKKYHPDLSGHHTEAEFKKVNDAYTSILRERGF